MSAGARDNISSKIIGGHRIIRYPAFFRYVTTKIIVSLDAWVVLLKLAYLKSEEKFQYTQVAFNIAEESYCET